MDSASHSAQQSSANVAAEPEPHPSYLANVLGILIALTTLAFPLFAIAHFSATDTVPQRPLPSMLQMSE